MSCPAGEDTAGTSPALEWIAGLTAEAKASRAGGQMGVQSYPGRLPRVLSSGLEAELLLQPWNGSRASRAKTSHTTVNYSALHPACQWEARSTGQETNTGRQNETAARRDARYSVWTFQSANKAYLNCITIQFKTKLNYNFIATDIITPKMECIHYRMLIAAGLRPGLCHQTAQRWPASAT